MRTYLFILIVAFLAIDALTSCNSSKKERDLIQQKKELKVKEIQTQIDVSKDTIKKREWSVYYRLKYLQGEDGNNELDWDWLNGRWVNGSDYIEINTENMNMVAVMDYETIYRGGFSIEGSEIVFGRQQGYSQTLDIDESNQRIGDKKAGLWFRKASNSNSSNSYNNPTSTTNSVLQRLEQANKEYFQYINEYNSTSDYMWKMQRLQAAYYANERCVSLARETGNQSLVAGFLNRKATLENMMR